MAAECSRDTSGDGGRQRASRWLPLLLPLGTLAVGVWIAITGWVSQDAFITFRYVEMLWAGNGLVFNSGERVQGFTHPLWLLALAASPPEFLYYWSILLGAICSSAALLAAVVALRSTQAPGRWEIAALVFVGLLLSSRSFREWSTSGLENSLSHALLGLMILIAADRTLMRTRHVLFLLEIGLLVVNRDYLLVIAETLV